MITLDLDTTANCESLLEFIKNLKKINSLKMPVFQRAYAWADAKKIKDKKIERYLKDFLFSENSNFLGTVLTYKTTSISSTTSEKEIYIADGQHRLVVVCVLLHVIKEKLIDFPMDDEKLADIYEIFAQDIPFNLNYTNKNLKSTNISNSLREIEESLQEQDASEQLKNNPLKITKDIVEKCLDHELKSTNIIDFLKKLSANFKRIKVCKIEIAPLKTEDEKPEKITAAVYEIFIQLNGEAIPLNPEEIYEAHISQLRENKKHEKPLEKIDISLQKLKDWDLTNIIERKIDFLAKASDTPELPHVTWVLRCQQQPVGTLQNSWENLLSTLTPIFTSNKDVTMLVGKNIIKRSKSGSLFAFLSKVGKNEDMKSPRNQKILVQLLLLIELMPFFKNVSKTNFNISRDLHKQNTIDDAIKYIYNHFKINSLKLKENLTAALASNTAIGSKSQHRDIAKLLLVLPDIELNGIIQKFSLLDSFTYEHILPQALETMLEKEQNLDEGIKRNYADIIADSRIKDCINLIGNGAILEGKENSVLQNKTPYTKAIMGDSTLAWWEPHRQCLIKHKENWSADIIIERSQKISKCIIDWIFSEELKELFEKEYLTDEKVKRKFKYYVTANGTTKEFLKLSEFYKQSILLLHKNISSFEEYLNEECEKEINSRNPWIVYKNDSVDRTARYSDLKKLNFKLNLTKNGTEVISLLYSISKKFELDYIFEQKEIS